jgi:acetylornithine deacetylase
MSLASQIAGDRENIIALCQDLVRLNTVNPYSGDAQPGGERVGQEYLQPRLAALGAQTLLLDCPDDIYQRSGILGPRQRNFSGRPNLIATWDFGGEGPTVVLNGHMDTVGIDNMPGDPLSAEVREGCIHGRGTSDCKGGLTVGVSAIAALLATGRPLQGRLIFQSVVDEECNGGGAGTLACLDAGYGGDVAVFLDGNEQHLTLGCGGCLTADVGVVGEEGHAAMGTGMSAIEKALVVKGAIDAFKASRESARPDCRVNLGIFHAGQHPAVVPGSARLALNIVYAAQEAADARDAGGQWGGKPIREEFEALIRAAEYGDEWLAAHPSHLEWVKDLIPYSQDPQDPWVQRFAAAYERVHGTAPVCDRMVAWSDAAHPQALYHIPTVLFGPGKSGCAHSSHECVEIEALVNCTQVVAEFLQATLGQADSR